MSRQDPKFQEAPKCRYLKNIFIITQFQIKKYNEFSRKKTVQIESNIIYSHLIVVLLFQEYTNKICLHEPLGLLLAFPFS